MDQLIAVLEDTSILDNDYAVSVRRTHTAHALGRIGNERARLALERVLTDEDFHVREAATKALSELGKTKGP